MSADYFNEWLDEYNDHMRLFEMFGDDKYHQNAKEIIENLKVMIYRIMYKKMILCKLESDKTIKL